MLEGVAQGLLPDAVDLVTNDRVDRVDSLRRAGSKYATGWSTFLRRRLPTVNPGFDEGILSKAAMCEADINHWAPSS